MAARPPGDGQAYAQSQTLRRFGEPWSSPAGGWWELEQMTSDQSSDERLGNVLYGVQDRIGLITLNRPEQLNAYTPDLAFDLKRAFARAANDPEVRVIVLTGAGRGFCAGMDMTVLADQASGALPEGPDERLIALESAFRSAEPSIDAHFADAERFNYFLRTRKPVIAAVNGPAAGFGFIMALYADFRIASEKAIFTTSFAQRGLIAEHGSSWLLPRLIGYPHAADLLLTARRVSAQEALEIGLVHRVFPQDGFLERVRGFASEMAETVSPRSMATIKAQLIKGMLQTYDQALADADRAMNATLTHEDFAEGVAHFLEKRKPRFAALT
jgi:enoyl-CoA hydratase/carnithine racemase